MKKFGIFMCAIALLGVFFTSCKDNKKTGADDIVEDGFYVIGEATAIADLKADNAAKGLMAAGTNEVGKVKRAGMYEKYIALEAEKDFELVLREGKTEVRYGAELTLSDSLEGSDVPQIQVYKGVMAENTKMRVTKSGLYHIILDLNISNDLKNKLIMVVPVEWGVRGAMNGWGYTAMEASEFNKSSMTFVVEEALVKDDGQFKFAHSNGWKFQLDEAGLVKAENNFGTDAQADGGEYTSLLPGGKNFGIARGYWKIELKWEINGGALEKSFTCTSTKVKEYKPAYENLYMIGAEFGDWKWDSENVVTFTPVAMDGENGEGQFWTIRSMTAGKGFKFSTEKAWGGDFATRTTTTGVTVDADGNATVDADGLYFIHVDLKNDKMTVEPAAVYGIGDAFGSWDKAQEAAKFAVENGKLIATATGAGELRMYVESTISNTDWWTREFIVLDGKIVCRGKGGEQERVKVNVGQKITLDFNAGTGSIQ